MLGKLLCDLFKELHVEVEVIIGIIGHLASSIWAVILDNNDFEVQFAEIKLIIGYQKPILLFGHFH